MANITEFGVANIPGWVVGGDTSTDIESADQTVIDQLLYDRGALGPFRIRLTNGTVTTQLFSTVLAFDLHNRIMYTTP